MGTIVFNTILLKCPLCQSDTVAMSFSSQGKVWSDSNVRHCPICRRVYSMVDCIWNLLNYNLQQAYPTLSSSSNQNSEEHSTVDYLNLRSQLTLFEALSLSLLLRESDIYQAIPSEIRTELLPLLVDIWGQARSTLLEDQRTFETSGEKSHLRVMPSGSSNPSLELDQKQLEQFLIISGGYLSSGAWEKMTLREYMESELKRQVNS